ADEQRLLRGAEHLESRKARDSFLLLHLGKFGRFSQSQTNEQAYEHEDCGDEERNPPTPGHELVIRHELNEEEHEAREHRSGRHTGLWTAAVERFLMRRSMFDGHEHGTAPLTADAKALRHTQYYEQDRCGHADSVVTRQEADREGGHTHHEQGQHEHRLATELVTEVTEDQSAEGTGNEGDSEGTQGSQLTGQRVEGGEELLVEREDGSRAAQTAVVPCDQATAHTGMSDLRRSGPRAVLAGGVAAGAASRRGTRTARSRGVCTRHHCESFSLSSLGTIVPQTHSLPTP